jgi:glutathione S-transferase
MTAESPGIILHHFDQSPFGEKVRVIFGFKNIAWQSVRVSRILPRPDLMPLTGGYRRTPVMQIGADIFCDTQVMIRELEARYPKPTLVPAGQAGIPYALAMWSDRVFFQNTVNLVFGTNADKIPQEFIEDRTQLRGARFDIAAMKAAIPQMMDQFRAHVDWIEAQLGDGRKWLLGDPSLADVNAYMNIWYLRTNLADADKTLDRFPRTMVWENRIREIGHGRRTEISSADALAIAAKVMPQTTVQADPYDPDGRKPGDQVIVTPDDYGRVAVAGEIVSLSAQHIAIHRQEERTGDIVVHFPRAGFLVSNQR